MVDRTAPRPAYDFTRVPLMAAAPPVIQLGKTKQGEKKKKQDEKKKKQDKKKPSGQSKKIVESDSGSEEEKEEKVAIAQPKPQITPVIEPEGPRSRKAQRQQRQRAEVELEKQKQPLENPQLEAVEPRAPEESPATKLHNWVIEELNEIDPDPDVLEYLKNEPGFKDFIALEAKDQESSSEDEGSKAKATKGEETKAIESKAEESKAEESKAEESKAEESKAEESKAEESKTEESKAEESKTESEGEEEKSPAKAREERLRKEAYDRYYQARKEFKSRPGVGGGGGSDWASKETRRQAKTLSEAHVEADTSFPIFPGKEKREYTLDHKVSQHNLKKIEDEAKKTGNRGKLAVALGADDEAKVKKKLLNLPANLELGPPGNIRKGDPGSGFDPNLTSSGRLTPRSESLSHIDRMAESGKIDWNELTRRLNQLSDQQKISAPVTSQWKKQGSRFVRDVPSKAEELKLGRKQPLKERKRISDSDSEESEIAEPYEFKQSRKSENKKAPEKISLPPLTPTTKAPSPTLTPLDFGKEPSLRRGNFPEPFESTQKPGAVTLGPRLERSTPTNQNSPGKTPLLLPSNPSRGGPGLTLTGGYSRGGPSSKPWASSPRASFDERKQPTNTNYSSKKPTITNDSDDDAEFEEALYQSTLETSGRGGGSSRGGFNRGGPSSKPWASSPRASFDERKQPTNTNYSSKKPTITNDSDDDAEFEEALRRSVQDTGGFSQGGEIELERKESRELSPPRLRLEPRERTPVSNPKQGPKPKIVSPPSTLSPQPTPQKTTPPTTQTAPRERAPQRLTSPRNRNPKSRGGTWQKKRRDSEDEEKF